MNIARNLDTNLLEIKRTAPKKQRPHQGWLAYLFN